ncbi:uncharacterized protein LOC112194514 [Rosa chinensis]|uniref:uncharacterized protein LOC112194514 n=1 Tax=Rosa chinensis TaxID=74649 RepID=UPI000D08AEDD|nr:uncharacterized protein LOC112194514 [Rosa chinensis]
MEVYVDDMLVKSLTPEDHITNLSIVFAIILRNGMRLNLQKCIFGVKVGKFLGYIISHRGIEVNPEKVQAILDMISPTYRNEVQSLTGQVAALSRFISRLTDKCTHFFKLLKTQHVEVIAWTAGHEAAFLGLKAYLAEVPLLYKLVPGEMLYMYLATSSTAVSSALIRRDSDCCTRCTTLQKVILVRNPVRSTHSRPTDHSRTSRPTPSYLQRFPVGCEPGQWAKNDKADALAKIAATSPSPAYGATKVEILEKSSTSKTVSEIFTVDHTASWMDSILKYMVDSLTPDNKVEARRLQLRSARYMIMNEKLYRRGHCFPSLKCVTPEDGHKIMKDIHAGVCGNHVGARSLAHKTLRAGYFWPTMSALAQTISSSCHKCQIYANIPRAPPIALSILLAPWPFCQWGLNLIGKLPTAVGQFKYAIVAVDYQTKWVEVEPLVAITTEKVKNFLWKNIYYRFGVPNTIVTDNGTQLTMMSLGLTPRIWALESSMRPRLTPRPMVS